MAYEKTVWTKGEVVTAEKLNKIEDGIDAASKKIGNTVMSTAGNQLNDNALTSENLASVGFVETRIRDLIGALNPLGHTKAEGEEAKKAAMARQILQQVTFVDGRAFKVDYADIPLATTTGTGLMRVGANLDVTDTGIVKVSDTIDSSSENNLVLNENVTIGKNTVEDDIITSYGNVTVEGVLVASRGIIAKGVIKAADTENSLILNNNITIGKNTTDSDNNITSYGNVTIKGLLTATRGISTSQFTSDSITASSQITSPSITASDRIISPVITNPTTASELVIGTVVTANQVVVSRSALTVQATATFNGSSTFNESSTFNNNVTMTGQLNAPNMVAHNINSNTVNNLVLNENITIGKKTGENENISYGKVTVAGLIMANGGITTPTISNSTLTIGTATVNEDVTPQTITRSALTIKADTAFEGASTFEGASIFNEGASIKRSFQVGTAENNVFSNFFGIVNISSDVTISGSLNCNSDVTAPEINWTTQNQTGLNYRSLIKTEGTVYSLFAQYGESSAAVYNTILEYKPNITGLDLNGILNIGTAIPTTGNINTDDSTIVNTINIAAKNAVRLKTVNAGTSIILDSNTKINGTLEIINDTNGPVLSIGSTNATKVEFTHTNIANLASLPSLPSTSGDYILHYDGSQYTWVSKQLN